MMNAIRFAKKLVPRRFVTDRLNTNTNQRDVDEQSTSRLSLTHSTEVRSWRV